MRAAECSFCQHTNPPDAKFCNSCGAPLYLVPCPHCGALNEITASACHQCARTLQGRTDLAVPPPPRVRKSAGAGSGASAAGTPDASPRPLTSEELDSGVQTFATLQRLRQLLDQSDSDATTVNPALGIRNLQRLRQLLDQSDSDATTVNPALGIPNPPAPRGAHGAAEDDSAGPRRFPVSAVTEPSAPRAEPRAAHRGRLAVMIGAVALGVFAASAYYAYRSVADTRAVPIADKAGDAGAPVATGIVVEPPVLAAPASPTPAAVVAPAVAPSAAPASTVPPVRPGTAIPGEAGRPETGPPARSTAATADQHRSGTEAKDSSSGVAAAAPAAVPRPRTSEAAAGFELQQPRVGPCTEAVAALGLCKREPTQGRE